VLIDADKRARRLTFKVQRRTAEKREPVSTPAA
jgi:hypothetical protein